MPSGELSTTGIVQDALTHGKEVYVPYIYNVEPPVLQQKTSVMDMLLLESMEEFRALELDKWGIPSLQKDQALRKKNCFGGRGLTYPAEPQATHDAEQGLDLIVMPGMAFDLEFRRLGHGKGFYDHFLTRYSGKETAVTPKMPFLGKRSCARTTRMKQNKKREKQDQRQEKKKNRKEKNRNPDSFTVALALEEQMLSSPDELPVSHHDWPVDSLIVGDGRVLVRQR